MTVLGVDQLVALYEGPHARECYDESVTELEHALQAATLAVTENADPALVAAALLHDIGHLIVGDLVPIDAALSTDAEHEQVGARYLRTTFGPEVTAPVALHVAAKRYLVAVDDRYASTLSPSSVRSLAVQGGPMTAAEVTAFEANPGWERAVRVRRWDDAAKVAGAPTPEFRSFRDLLVSLAAPSSA